MRKGSKMTSEQKERVSKGRIGKTAWNKGIRSTDCSEKYCTNCNKIFFKDPNSGNKQWLKRIFCSKSCALIKNTRTLGKNLGENNKSWKGGITKINFSIRSSYEMDEWRRSVFKRDKYTCRGCNKIGCKLNAHHIKSFSKYPELRFDIHNGLTLCIDCHKKTDNYAGQGENKLHRRTNSASSRIISFSLGIAK